MKKNVNGIIAGIAAGCMVLGGSAAAFADEQVTFLLPIDYFCLEEDETESTQEQLDEHSKDGLKYAFTEDGQILCTVEDQEEALKAVIRDMEEDFAECQDPNGDSYIKSYQKLEYSEDLTEITVTCKAEDWGMIDGFYSMIFIARARDYQLIQGLEEADMKCEMKFVDENGEVIESDSMDNYKEDAESEAE